MCFLSNQIAGFFDHKYLWKKSIYILIFEYGQLYLSSNQIVGFFDQYYHENEPINILIFVDEDTRQGTDIIKGW